MGQLTQLHVRAVLKTWESGTLVRAAVTYVDDNLRTMG